MAFLLKIWDGIRSVISLILPAFARVKDARLFGPTMRWILHGIILTAVLLLSYVVNKKTGFGNSFVSSSMDWLRDWFLTLIVILVYAMSWVAKWLWELLQPKAEASDFPDIDDAWAKAIDALREQQTELTDAPLFLVVGRAAEGSQLLMQAGGIKSSVKQPAGKEPPLRIFGTRESIFISCEGASLLSKQAQLAVKEEFEMPADMPGGGTSTIGAGEFKTMGVGFGGGKTFGGEDLSERIPAAQRIMAAARAEGRSADQLTEEERLEIEQEEKRERAKRQELVKKRGKTSLDRNRREIDNQVARLRYLCSLIARDRKGFCPLNGVLVLIGLQTTDSDEIAEQTSNFVQMELQAIREATKLRCPVFAVLCDLERASGFGTFSQRLSEDKRKQRVGQRFELVPDVSPEQLPGFVEKGVGGVCLNIIPKWVQSLFRTEKAQGQESLDEALRVNSELFRFMSDLVMRQKRVGRVVRRLVPANDDVPLFAGCYFAGSGSSPAFLPGIFRRMIEEQNFVSWTNEAEAEDRRLLSSTTYGYVALAVWILVVVGGVAFWYNKNRGA